MISTSIRISCFILVLLVFCYFLYSRDYFDPNKKKYKKSKELKGIRGVQEFFNDSGNYESGDHIGEKR